jgi:Ca2+-binding EF-hand superfamily protein
VNKFLLSGAAGVALVTGSALVAQAAPSKAPAHPGHKMMQTELRAEVQANVAKMFTRLDTNKDGFVTEAEINALQAAHAAKSGQGSEARAAHFDPAKIFARLDTNKDGKITQAEADAVHNAKAASKDGKAAPAHANGLFARIDTNKDGVVTRAEFDAEAAQMHARMENAGQRHGMGGRMFAAADLNKDGKVSLAEMQQTALQHFDRADANHDGKLTPDERKQMRQAQPGQHKA